MSICGRAIYRLPVQMCDIKTDKSLGLKEDVRQTNRLEEAGKNDYRCTLSCMDMGYYIG